MFFRDHEPTLASSFLFVTWGTYFDMILDTRLQRKLNPIQKQDPLAAYRKCASKWVPRINRLKAGYSLRPGKHGGILEMAEHLEASAGTDRIETLIFLTHPADLEEGYPEDKALLRSAIRNDVTYLSTYWSASHWAAFEAGAKGYAQSGSGRVRKTDPENEILALIAHDDMKLALCRWVVANREKIRRFREFVTTGTTGEWVKRFLEASGVPARKIDLVDRKQSGPKGGDVEIAGSILRGEVHHVVFFVDPMTSHPHESDVQALLRTCAMPGVSVNLRLNEASATSWINSI